MDLFRHVGRDFDQFAVCMLHNLGKRQQALIEQNISAGETEVSQHLVEVHVLLRKPIKHFSSLPPCSS